MGCRQCGEERQSDLLSPSEAVTETVRRQMLEYPVLLYSSTTCASSQELKHILRSLRIPFEYFEVDNMSNSKQTDDRGAFLAAVLGMSGEKSTPVLCVQGKIVAGLGQVAGDAGAVHVMLQGAGVPLRRVEGKLVYSGVR